MTAPTVGHTHEVRRRKSITEKTVRNESGVTVISEPDPLIEIEVTQTGKGDPGFANVTAGDFTAGQVEIVESEISEKWDDFPDFSNKGQAWDTWVPAA